MLAYYTVTRRRSSTAGSSSMLKISTRLGHKLHTGLYGLYYGRPCCLCISKCCVFVWQSTNRKPSQTPCATGMKHNNNNRCHHHLVMKFIINAFLQLLFLLHSFSKPIMLISWFLAEISVLLTDLPAVIGVAIAFNTLFGLPYFVGVLMSFVSTIFCLVRIFWYDDVLLMMPDDVTISSLHFISTFLVAVGTKNFRKSN